MAAKKVDRMERRREKYRSNLLLEYEAVGREGKSSSLRSGSRQKDNIGKLKEVIKGYLKGQKGGGRNSKNLKIVDSK